MGELTASHSLCQGFCQAGLRALTNKGTVRITEQLYTGVSTYAPGDSLTDSMMCVSLQASLYLSLAPLPSRDVGRPDLQIPLCATMQAPLRP